MKFLEILQKAIVCKWSDIHLTTDKNIYYRQNNKLNIWEDEFFTREDFREVIENTLNETQKMLFRLCFMNLIKISDKYLYDL